jgi:LacI family transcriptional regulator
MAVRMKDIARDLGVSVVTVSKVLRNHSDISAATRERVLKRIDELNYKPNLAARALVTGRSYIIGFVVPDLVHSFFAQVAKSLASAVRTKGYNVVISSSDEDPLVERQEIEQLLARRVDALVVAAAGPSFEGLLQIEDRPYILIDRKFEGHAAHFVGVDDEAIGEIATEHLIAIGCERIAHIAGPAVSTGTGRMNGYKRSLKRHGITPQSKYIVMLEHGDLSVGESGYAVMRKLLTVEPRPDGVFCHNDTAGMGAMQAILEAGLRIPEDIALVGAGNVHYAPFLRVPLTSVDQQSHAIGEQTGKLVLNLIESKRAVRPKEVLLEPKLIIRESTMRQRK